jgi:hypothetical protein
MAHHSQTADAAARVASQIEDEARAPWLRDSSADVARDVHSQNAGKHADSDQGSLLRHFRYRDHLVRNDDRTLLLSRTRNVQSRSDGRSIAVTLPRSIGAWYSSRSLSVNTPVPGPNSMTDAEAAVIATVIVCASARLDGTIAATRDGSAIRARMKELMSDIGIPRPREPTGYVQRIRQALVSPYPHQCHTDGDVSLQEFQTTPLAVPLFHILTCS